MTAPGRPGPADGGPRRIWLIAILFGLVSSLVLGAIVVLAARSSDDASRGGDGSGPGAVPVPGTASVDGPVDAVLLGDSITELSQPTLEERLSDRWSLWIDGRSGNTVADQLGPAEEGATRHPTQVVVNLGTNDVTYGRDLSASVASLRQMLDLFPSARCLHVVTVHEAMVFGGASFSASAAEYNRRLREMAAADPRVSVIEWDDALAAAEAAGATPADLLYDTIHLTERGERVLADAYAGALSACPADRLTAPSSG